jgi:hypothetical protein
VIRDGRLGAVELLVQLTCALLAFREDEENLQARFIAERLECGGICVTGTIHRCASLQTSKFVNNRTLSMVAV